MDWIYSCPKCTAIVNPGPNVILLGRREGREVLLAFHPEPGNYEVAVPHNIAIEKGEVWELFCPVCHENLTFAAEDKMVALNMTTGAGDWHKVLFSRVAGEKATFIVTQEPEPRVEAHGADLSQYDHTLWIKYT